VHVEFFPWIDVSDNIGLALYSGFGMNIPGEEFASDDALVMWLVHPYMIVNLGNPRFTAGFRMHGNNNRGVDRVGNTRTMGWEIPIGMQFSW
jgi:hypothetical protein